jgi:hypothetical protein
LYLRVHDFLDAVDAYREPSEFLNYPSGQLAQFVKITSSNSYLVGRGPKSILEIVCSELDEQRVAYNVIVNPVAPNASLLVRWGNREIGLVPCGQAQLRTPWRLLRAVANG